MTTMAETLDSLMDRLCHEQRLRGQVIQGIAIQRAYDEWSRAGMPNEPFADAHLDRVFQAGICYALHLFGKHYMGVEQWDGGDGTETIDGDVLVEIGNIFRAAEIVDAEGDPLDGRRIYEALIGDMSNVLPLRRTLDKEGG